MNYPQLFLSSGFLENTDKVFPPPVKPIEPVEPVEPVEPSNIRTFFTFILVIFIAVFLFFIKLPFIIPVILVGGFLYYSYSEKEEYKNDLRKYTSDVTSFNKAIEQYKIEIEITHPQNYQEYKRIQVSELILNSAAPPIESTDYKKGVSHDYFKRFLVEHFNDSILESTSINVPRYPSYYQNEFNLYVCDFAYIDKYINLKIDIEIDEPYTFETKQPIHLNDKKRNDFFIQNNWAVIRFAEEQVILYPELCCNYIKEVINCFYCDYSGFRNLKTPLPKVPKWNSESVKILIAKNYRDTYLNGKIYFTL